MNRGNPFVALASKSPVVLWSENGSTNVHELARYALTYAHTEVHPLTAMMASTGVSAKITAEDMQLLISDADRLVREGAPAATRRGEIPAMKQSLRAAGAKSATVSAVVPFLVEELVQSGIRTADDLEAQVADCRSLAETFTIDGEPMHDLISAGVPKWMRTPMRLY